jgi:hypothetical protein
LSLWERRFFLDLGAAIHEKGATAQIAYAGFFLDFRKFPVRIIIVACLSSTYTLSPNSAQGNGGPLKWGES